MNILKQSVRDELFNGENLIYTKVKDQVPTKYGNNAKIADCMIADGCFIEGNVENSIIFRGVRIGKDAMVRNCIIMQNTYVQESCDLEHVVIDKECLIRSGKRLIGQGNYPIIIRKRAVV